MNTTGSTWAEPYKIKMVGPRKMTTEAGRQTAIVEAGYKTFLLQSENACIGLLTGSGCGAMSDRQWAGMMQGDAAYAGSANHHKMRDTKEEYCS